MNYSQVERDNIARVNRLAIDCDPLYLSFPIKKQADQYTCTSHGQ